MFWPILQTFGIIYGHLIYLLVNWYIFSRFGKYYREKSGNPDPYCSCPLMTFELTRLQDNQAPGPNL
jgi:hypothetical protein